MPKDPSFMVIKIAFLEIGVFDYHIFELVLKHDRTTQLFKSTLNLCNLGTIFN